MPEKVFVVLWDDDGEPNCTVYGGANALCEGLDYESKEALRIASAAVESPGEAVALPRDPDFRCVRFVSVLP